MEVIQMAHAGTMGLGQTTKAARGGNAWMALAVIVAIMAVTVGALWFTSGSGLTSSSALVARPATDTSYDQVEKLRIAAGRGPLADDSYDRIEGIRGAIAAPALTLQQIERLRYGKSLAFTGKGSVVTEQVEAARNGNTLVFAATGSRLVIDGDHAYDPIENLRGGGAIVSDHPLDPIEQLRLGGATVPVKRDRVGGP
jgi:hypothetical protein